MVGGVPLLPWQAVSIRPARATTVNRTAWPTQYAPPFDLRNPLKVLELSVKCRAAFGKTGR